MANPIPRPSIPHLDRRQGLVHDDVEPSVVDRGRGTRGAGAVTPYPRAPFASDPREPVRRALERSDGVALP